MPCGFTCARNGFYTVKRGFFFHRERELFRVRTRVTPILVSTKWNLWKTRKPHSLSQASIPSRRNWGKTARKKQIKQNQIPVSAQFPWKNQVAAGEAFPDCCISCLQIPDMDKWERALWKAGICFCAWKLPVLKLFQGKDRERNGSFTQTKGASRLLDEIPEGVRHSRGS